MIGDINYSYYVAHGFTLAPLAKINTVKSFIITCGKS